MTTLAALLPLVLFGPPLQNMDAAAVIRERIEGFDAGSGLRIGNELIHASSLLKTFYGRRGFEPVWFEGEKPRPTYDQLVAAIQGAVEEGLDPLDYHYDRIVNLKLAAEARRLGPSTDLIAELDLLATDAFLLYADHLFHGAVHPVTIDPHWFVEHRQVDLVPLFERAVETGNVTASLASLAPRDAEYVRLRELLARYRELAKRKPAPLLPGGAPLRPGSRDGRVRVLRERLAIVSDGSARTQGNEEELYDESLAEAVRDLQRRYGLVEDGIVGGATREALNRTPEDLIEHIRVNMERWRWLPEELGSRHLRVNIAGFELEAREEDRTVLSMRVVVGLPYRATPVFSSHLTHVVVHPSWTVPETIVKEDLLPAVRKDVAYLQERHLRVFDGWSDHAPELDPRTIDWSTVPPLRYRFRQDPGPWSPLGRIKFLLPNPHDVYLHDTPERALFVRPERIFSSGCVRLEAPFELLELLLDKEPPSLAAEVARALGSGEEKIFRLSDGLPIHVLYWTVWVDGEGEPHFRKDVYGRDAPLAEALHARPPRER